MDKDVVAQARTVVNPFVSNRVDSAWDADAVDVESINRSAFQHCTETIELVRSTGQCRGLLLSGEPGSGKTHLLQRVRRHVQRGALDCFAYVPPVSGPDRFFKDVLQHTVQDLVGIRPGSPSSQLENLLVRELVAADTSQRLPAETFWADLRRRHPPGEALFAWLEERMQKLCSRLQIDPDVTLALHHYLAEHRRHDAYSWLVGRSVSELALERLGIDRTLEEDPDALQALIALSRIAGSRSVLVVAFDQLEGLQIDERDQQGLKAFATELTKLFVECRNIAAISCVQTYFKRDLERAVSRAHMDRIAQDQGALTLLQEAPALELVRERLNALPELERARAQGGQNDALWPLSRDSVSKLVPPAGIPARQLLNQCRDLFEQWRNSDASTTIPTESLKDIWDSRIEQMAAQPPDEGVLADGLLKLIEARTRGKGRRAAQRGLDLIVDASDGEVGVAVCHAENMTSLASRLKRLQDVAGSGQLKRLVIVRDERLRISPTAKKTRERLDALQQMGHSLVRAPAEAYAAIAAARQLLADAAAGDLSLNGRPVAPEDLKTWLAGNLNAATRDLLEAIDGGETSGANELLDQVEEMLEGRWVVGAAEIASSIGVAEAALLDRLTTEQHSVGILSGPPAVLYLRPEGLRRE